MTTPPVTMPALVTPFDDRGELDLDAHAHNVAFLTELGIEGFVLAGSNGEGPYLEDGERARLVATARKVAPGAHLMLGVMAETVRGALRQVSEAGDADSLLVMTPTSLVRNLSRPLVTYFEHVCDGSDVPVFLYSVPPTTAYSLPLDLVVELSHHPQVAGMKDSSGDVVRLQSIVEATDDDFILYSGVSAAVTAALAVGCHGVITGSGNYVAPLLLATVDKYPVRHLQRQLTAVSAAVDSLGLPGVKAASAAAGLRPGLPRLPLQPLAPDVAAALAELLPT